MRVLFTFIGGSGHFRPLVAVARAVEAAGHTVAVAGSGKVTPVVEAAGFVAFPTSGPRVADAPPAAPEPLVAVDPAAEERHFAAAFGRSGARRHAAALLELAGEWRPDVIVRDEADFGSAIAAERLGIPCATVLVLAAGSLVRKELLAEPLGQLRAEYGLPPDPGLAMLDRELVLSPFPPSFRSPDFPLPQTAFSYRTADVVPIAAVRETPTVYFTLGTVFRPDTDDLFSRVLAGLREVPAKVVVTVGERNDPAALGPQPGHVRVERFVPQEELLPYCDLVVSHGGSGSLLGALAHGLPSVLLPLGADQPHNAQRCLELGLGRVLDAVTVGPDEVAATVTEVLADQDHRRAAQRIQTEINGLPDVTRTVALLEASGRR
ncbi:glycosyltransferase, MGT family [Kribbella flavida DSM 17836]|uniref:Glycosyltransferase, MGT family n=1 Tax=Kribbella flavida (strain DSM 17836 / JCM 10339 / NBRC 14399) TaxID=479435 RepID=D2PQ02_KRIFD|nr:glycosyltransferase [Kribbella flavida]ADB32926.1 glycosyltransferase, MGT family [Kribbella flavida DSM 17836]